MTKEELIALSDLNREDNIKYISSEAQGIAIALDSDRYSPTLCKLERAYICGRRKSEEQIAKLEESNKEWQRTCEAKSDTNSQLIEQLSNKAERIAELEAQKKELQCCANCRYSYGGEEEPHHDCGYCHAMQCICKLKLEEHTSDIYRMWEDKCERWEMRVN